MSLSLTLGVMNSGKTSYLLSQASRLNSIGLKALYINHSLDTRSTDEVSTHNPLLVYKDKLPNITFVKVARLRSLDTTSFHSIMIDEGHLFEDLVDGVTLFKRAGKHVHVSALIGDYRRKPFGEGLALIPLCDNPAQDVTFPIAYCRLCAEEHETAVTASTSYRIDKGDKDQVSIGGHKKYMTLCTTHYEKLMEGEH